MVAVRSQNLTSLVAKWSLASFFFFIFSSKLFAAGTVTVGCASSMNVAAGTMAEAAWNSVSWSNIANTDLGTNPAGVSGEYKALYDANYVYLGFRITDPNINFAMVAKGMGVYSEGPITDPKDLGPAILRAKEVVKRGEPALVEAVTQPR